MFIVVASILYQITCLPSVDSDQPTHLRSLVRVSAQSGQSIAVCMNLTFSQVSAHSRTHCCFSDLNLKSIICILEDNMHFIYT